MDAYLHFPNIPPNFFSLLFSPQRNEPTYQTLCIVQYHLPQLAPHTYIHIHTYMHKSYMMMFSEPISDSLDKGVGRG